MPAEQRNAKDDELACPLPEMNVQKVKVIFADDRESSESTSDHGEEAWSAIERGGVIPQSLLAAAPGANWLSGGPRTIEIEQTAVCASGEDVKIDVDLKNPLRVPLDVNNSAFAVGVYAIEWGVSIERPRRDFGRTRASKGGE